MRVRQEKQNNIFIIHETSHLLVAWCIYKLFSWLTKHWLWQIKEIYYCLYQLRRKKKATTFHCNARNTNRILRDVLFLHIVNCVLHFISLSHTMNTHSPLVSPRDTNSDRTQIRTLGFLIDLASLTRIVSVCGKTTTRYDCAYREWSILSRQIKARRSN